MDIRIEICPNPIFIIGSPRSGTTALAWALAQHSQLWTSGESYIAWELFGSSRGREGLDLIQQTSKVLASGSWLSREQIDRRELLAHLGLGINALYTSRSQGRRWIDHTPIQTLMADSLAEMFPSATFLHILRDGRSVVHSMTNFLNALEPDIRANFEQAGWNIPWLEFSEACRTWRTYVTAANNFTTRHPDRCLTVRQEQLVTDPESCLSAIYEFLGVSRERPPIDCIRNHRLHSSTFATPGEESSTKKPWAAWCDDQKRIFAREAGAVFKELPFGDLQDFHVFLSAVSPFDVDDAQTDECQPSNRNLPLFGPLELVGSAVGLWHDEWIGDSLRFRFVAAEPLGRFVIQGLFPHAFADDVELTLSLNDAVVSQFHHRAGVFTWEGELSPPIHGRITAKIAFSQTFCPRSVANSLDSRQLSCMIERITFGASDLDRHSPADPPGVGQGFLSGSPPV